MFHVGGARSALQNWIYAKQHDGVFVLRIEDTDAARNRPEWTEGILTALEPVGNYAVKLVFDDMHDTGIFSWRYLYELGLNQQKVWAEYLRALEAKGLSRDPRPRH